MTELVGDDRLFPLIWPKGLPVPAGACLAVPWVWLERFEHRVLRNHGQDLNELADRGGLEPMELWAIAHDVDLQAKWVDTRVCLAWLGTKPWAS